MRLASLEGEMAGENPDGQLSKLWESIEELNLRCLFLMETLRITQVMSPIAGVNGEKPKRTIPALEAYMVGFGDGAPSGRDLLIARIAAQDEAMRKALEAQSGEGVSASGGEGEGEASTASTDGEGAEESQAAADQGGAANDNDGSGGAPTPVNNVSKFTKH